MANEKKTRFDLGMPFGRPATYNTPEEMHEKAMEYFKVETTPSGICKPTISGLMLFLGFESRQTFYDTKKRGREWARLCNHLIMAIESCYEKNLHGMTWAGSAFALRNINSTDWKDEVTQNQNITTVTAKFGSDIIQPTQEPKTDS